MPHPKPPVAEQIGEELLLWIDANPVLDAAITDAFPAKECRWDDIKHCWIISAHHYEELQELVRAYLGIVLVVA